MEGQVEQGGMEPGQAKAQVQRVSRVRLLWGAAIVVLAALAVVGAYLWTSGGWKAWRAVASVDGTRITRTQLEDHLAFLVRLGQLRAEVLSDPVRKKEVERLALDDLITRRLMLAEAERLRITVGTGEEDVVFGKAHGGQPGEPKLAEVAKKAGEDSDRMRREVRGQLVMTRLRDKITETVSVSDEEIANYYNSRRQAFASPALAHLRLLIGESREEAERLRGQALKGADFATLVREHSKGGNKESGGDLGWVDPRMLPASIASAVASIRQTGITPVVEAKGQFYIVRVEGRQDPRPFTLAEVKDQIRERLTAERKQAKFAGWIQERRRAARVEVYP